VSAYATFEGRDVDTRAAAGSGDVATTVDSVGAQAAMAIALLASAPKRARSPVLDQLTG
jgi:hypothetical protein